MRTIGQVLDRAMKVQNVKSDYKLALCLGIGSQSIYNYRLGKTLPDETACVKLAQSMGEDPALLTVEMQAQRAKTPEAKQVWLSIAHRLQMGFANVQMLLLVAIFSIAAIALPAWAGIYFAASTTNSLYIMLSGWLRRNYSRKALFVKVCKVAGYVPSHTHAAA